MKRIIGLLLLSSSMILASEYYAKLNPINTYNVKSAVSGQVVFVNNAIESKQATNSKVVKIDSKVNVEDLKQSEVLCLPQVSQEIYIQES